MPVLTVRAELKEDGRRRGAAYNGSIGERISPQESGGGMTPAQLEKRVVLLEAELARLKSKVEGAGPGIPWWERIAGTFQDDPVYEKAMQLAGSTGGHRRPSQLPSPEVGAAHAGTRYGPHESARMGRRGPAALRERLADVSPEDVVTTIISYEEQMRGWMAYLARAKSLDQEVEAYHRLRRHLDNYRQVPLLDFDQDCSSEFQSFRRARIRIGTMDLKIAAIVLSQGATLLSRNLVDFCQVPGLSVEDWTR